MPRANRHYIPGYVWHITHRCHKKEFLLKFGRDRRRWLNMVRAGVVKHPSEWPFSGYSEIQAPRERYAILDYEGLQELLNFRSMDDLANAYRRWIEDAVLTGDRRREGKWTESIAVGNESFVNATKEKLGITAHGREIIETDGSYVLRESPMPYKTILRQENEGVRPQNDYYWDDTVGISAWTKPPSSLNSPIPALLAHAIAIFCIIRCIMFYF